MKGPLLPAVLATLGLASVEVQAQSTFHDSRNVTAWAQGRYIYRDLETGIQNGEEDWYLTQHTDGSRILRATNAYIDRTSTFRQVVLRADARFRPLEAYTVVWVDGEFRGSGLFTVTGDVLEALIQGPNGRLSQTLTVPEGFSFVPHPISTDSWHTWYYDLEKGGTQTVTLYIRWARKKRPLPWSIRMPRRKLPTCW